MSEHMNAKVDAALKTKLIARAQKLFNAKRRSTRGAAGSSVDAVKQFLAEATAMEQAKEKPAKRGSRSKRGSAGSDVEFIKRLRTAAEKAGVVAAKEASSSSDEDDDSEYKPKEAQTTEEDDDVRTERGFTNKEEDQFTREVWAAAVKYETAFGDQLVTLVDRQKLAANPTVCATYAKHVAKSLVDMVSTLYDLVNLTQTTVDAGVVARIVEKVKKCKWRLIKAEQGILDERDAVYGPPNTLGAT